MALPLWGQLEKSQGDDQTIEEAIAAAIANHEADSEAHLGSGESLESHKTEDIIDHPQGSVLADKQTMTELSASTIFESLDGWSTTGDVATGDIPGMRIYVESGWQDEGSISTQPQVPKNFRDSGKDMLFQMLAHFDITTTDIDANFGFLNGLDVTPDGFGFVVDDGDLFAYARQSTNENKSSAISIDLTLDHVYRVFLDATEEEIYYFVDGTLVATLAIPGIGWQDDGGPQIWLNRGTASDGQLRVGVLNFSREI